MSKNLKDIVITSALRTPIGRYNGMFKTKQAHELGSMVIKEIFKRTRIEPINIDEIIFGQVLTGSTGQNPARQAAIEANIPVEKTAYLINQVCGSGLRAIVSGYQSILANDNEVVIAGGQECMSVASEELMLKDGLTDAFNNYHMGITAENVAEKWEITREEQDKFALNSQNKTQKAVKENKFIEEIILNKKDEYPREGVSLEKLLELKPAFKENGTVTAGNSSGINDGAAAVLLMTRQTAEKKGLKPLAKIKSWATSGVEPSLMGSGPIPASKKALDKAGWKIQDIDLVEANEAFAAQSIAVMKDLNIPNDKFNVNGGAIALGHPIGASGTRIVVTLIHEMNKRNVKKGLATLCIGGGMGISICIERD